MHDPAGNVVRVASLAVVDIVTGSGLGVLEGAVEKINLCIVFPHEAVTERMSEPEGAERTNGVGKE